jgi:multidrug efflux pump subunit AcrA (membrane-fusion protein)
MKVIMVLCFAVVAVIFVSKQRKPEGKKNNYEIMSVKKEQREIKTTIEGIIEISNLTEVKVTKGLKTKEINFHEGDQIKKGDVIATFSSYITRKRKNGKRYKTERIRRYVSKQDGYIFKMNLNIGEEVPEIAFVIVNPEDIKLYTGNIKSGERNKLLPGMSVTVKFSGNEKIKSEIIRVEKAGDSGELRGELAVSDIKGIIANADKNISIDAVLQDKKEILAIPVKTIIKKENSGKNYVYVVGSDNKVTEKQITIREVNGSVIDIEEGLEDGDRVILNPDSRLENGFIIKTEK